MTSPHPFHYHPQIAHLLGCAASAVGFCYILDTSPLEDDGGEYDWVTCTQAQMTAATGLSRRETDTARRKWLEIGIVEENVCGLPPTTRYRVNIGRLAELLAKDRGL